MWLSDCGLVHKVSRVNAAGIPLKAYEDLKAFKLFIVDVGLLGCMTGLRQRTLLDGDDLFIEFKGALTEQYVCQQLKTIEDLGVYRKVVPHQCRHLLSLAFHNENYPF